ncbi:hypothetical protein BKI52_40830 [marine bacterium AO1-C]|nr:hypothetical protein BKI52_40830 [marine bacterium AO1-C]
MKRIFLIFTLLGILFTSCKNSVLDELEQQKQVNQNQANIQNLGFNLLQKTDKVFYANWNGANTPFYSRHYYPTNTFNLPVVVISHADGTNQDYKDYDAIGFALAAQNMYVISINRKSNDMDEYDDFDELLTAHLKQLYLDKNGQTLPVVQGGGFQILKPLSTNVMLFGHSAGGRATLYKGKSVVQSLNLNLKAVVGLAPTMNVGAPSLGNTPFFIIQGTGDMDGGPCRHFEKVTNTFNAQAKVPIFEGYSGNAERAYVLLNSIISGHYIEDDSKVVTLTKAIALAYLKNNKTLFNQHIRHQSNKLAGTWVQYWDNANQETVYTALPFGQTSTLTPNGVFLSQNLAYRHLGNDPERTSTLHRSYTLKVTKNIFQIGNPAASFKIDFPGTVQFKQHLRFRAGQLFDFNQGENYSATGIDIRVRLIYKGIGRNAVSSWANMSAVCGKVINPNTINCPRNVMTSYVMPLSAFGYNGQQITAVEFDLGRGFNKTLMLDDIAFTNPVFNAVPL